jgi:hypothetical protein
VKFRSFAPVRFEIITVGGLEEADTLDKLLARIETAWEEERQANPGEKGTEWVVRFNVTGGSPSWKRLRDEEERVTLAREAAEELGLLDAEVQAGPLHPVVRVEDHLGRMDVLGTALRLLEDVRGGDTTVLGLSVEELAGLDHPDAMDAVAYVESLLEGADGELIARMLERETGQ